MHFKRRDLGKHIPIRYSAAFRAVKFSVILFGTSPKGFVLPDNSSLLLFFNKENIPQEVRAVRTRPHATAIPTTAPVLIFIRDFPLSGAPETR